MMILHLNCCGLVVVPLYMVNGMELLHDATYGDGKYLITGQCQNPVGSTDGTNWGY